MRWTFFKTSWRTGFDEFCESSYEVPQDRTNIPYVVDIAILLNMYIIMCRFGRRFTWLLYKCSSLCIFLISTALILFWAAFWTMTTATPPHSSPLLLLLSVWKLIYYYYFELNNTLYSSSSFSYPQDSLSSCMTTTYLMTSYNTKYTRALNIIPEFLNFDIPGMTDLRLFYVGSSAPCEYTVQLYIATWLF